MGINTKWIDELGVTFGWPEMKENEAESIDYVLDDAELCVRGLFSSAEMWKDISDRARARILLRLNADCTKTYYFLFDDSRYVPPNKSIEQASRGADIVPFSEHEQKHIVVGESTIPSPSSVFFDRLMKTSILRANLRSFIAFSLCNEPLKPGKSIVIDAVAPRMILEKSSCVYTVRNREELGLSETGTSAEDSAAAAAAVASIGLDVDLGIPVCDLDSPTVVTVTGREDGNGNDVHIAPVGNKIGEADYKIPYWISRLPSEVTRMAPENDIVKRRTNVYVRSYDTDIFPILLMHMRRWCERRYDADMKPIGNIKYNIFLSANAPTRPRHKERPVLNVVAFYTNIMTRLHEAYPRIRHTIETFCTILLLCGSDYLKVAVPAGDAGEMLYRNSHRYVTTKKVWDAFNSPEGFELLFPKGMETLPPIKTETKVDDTKSCFQLRIHETRIYNFLAFVHHYAILGTFPAASLFSGSAAFQNQYYDYSTLRPSASVRQMPASEEYLFVFVRQLAWQLGYLMNGASDFPFDDPLSKTRDGVSIYGWGCNDIASTSMHIHSRVVGNPFVPVATG